MRHFLALLRGASPDRAWFWSRFAAAAEEVVTSWGPPWARARVAGRPLGVWILTGAWLAIPVVVLLAVAQ